MLRNGLLGNLQLVYSRLLRELRWWHLPETSAARVHPAPGRQRVLVLGTRPSFAP